jgi:hypothetical protein
MHHSDNYRWQENIPRRNIRFWWLPVIIVFFFFLSSLSAENINDDFELTVALKEKPLVLSILIAPEPDRMIGGLSEEEPFITLISEDVGFEGGGQLIQTDYIKEQAPKEFIIPFSPERNQIKVTLTIHYVPCVESKGICRFPQVVERTFLLEKPGGFFSLTLFIILIAAFLFLFGLFGLILYLKCINKKLRVMEGGLFHIHY